MSSSGVSSSQGGVEFPLRLLRTTRPGRLSGDDIAALRVLERTDWSARELQLGTPEDEELAARGVSLGAIAGCSFGNGSVLLSHPGAAVVEHLRRQGADNAMAGITTTLRYVPQLFDWSKLPAPLTALRAMELIDTLFELGPFGFIGPAVAHIPAHLTTGAGLVHLLGPGYRCRSNVVVERAMELAGTHYLHVIASDERTDGWFNIRSHPSNAQYAAYRAGLPTVLNLCTLRVVHHGSLHIDHLRPILDSLGFKVELATDPTQDAETVLAA